jgi:hypothetical protein
VNLSTIELPRAANPILDAASLVKFPKYPIMADPTNTDLAVSIARIEGKLDSSILANSVQSIEINRRLEESAIDRRDLHKQIESLRIWRSWLTGAFGAVGVIVSFYATLRISGVIH